MFFHSLKTYNLLPPPETSKSRHSKPLKPPEESPLATTSTPTNTTTTTTSSPSKAFNKPTKDINQTYSTQAATATSTLTAYSDDPIKSAEEEWLRMTKSPSQSQPNSIEEPSTGFPAANYSSDDNTANGSTLKHVDSFIESANSSGQSTASASTAHFRDAFTDLDPLGTGKIKPYIDKKYFFQDLKNPPKKVLRDLSERESVFSANFTGNQHEMASSIAREVLGNQHEIVRPNEMNNATSSEFNNEIKGVDFAPNFTSGTLNPQDYFHAAPAVAEVVDDPIIGNNKALLVSDNDPFSPRMKKFDQFDDDFNKSGISDPFEFSFENEQKTDVSDRFHSASEELQKIHIDKKITDFNGPLQVNLPPESHKRLERHGSDAGDSSGSTGRSRPGAGVFKQNTVDNVINSISSKKMKPHLFSSQKYSKRDSNSINMRRLQESDSLSETESAPDPPPRPHDTFQSDPPPLPPKKPFSDIHIRPRTTSPSKIASSTDSITNRYAAFPSQKDIDPNSPALPLPSRKISRYPDQHFPGPTRPAKKTGNPNTDEDYLTPIGNEPPILLPPPQNRSFPKNRGRRHPEPNHHSSSATMPPASPNTERKTRTFKSVLPDITLSELLTLGIDDLASKLNVPVNRLSTMNIVELTQYLSDFIEKTSQSNVPEEYATTSPSSSSYQNKPKNLSKEATPEAAIFKVSFDNDNDATFIAKFDDNFGDTSPVPKFANFETTPSDLRNGGDQLSSVDRYAVFREIIEQEQQVVGSVDEEPQNDSSCGSEEQNSDSNEEIPAASVVVSPPIIDTKITQVIAHAKDRYAALRDIIMVEDLFDNSSKIAVPTTVVAPSPIAMFCSNFGVETTRDSSPKNIDLNESGSDKQTSPEINISMPLDSPLMEHIGEQQQLPQPSNSNKDDIEINEYMNRAISNLSLDSRDHLSPISNTNRSPLPNKGILNQTNHHQQQNASTSPIRLLMPTQANDSSSGAKTLANMSTSPIPSYSISHPEKMSISNSPMDQMLGVSLSPRSPNPQSPAVAGLMDDTRKRSLNSAGSLSDVVLCASSPDVDKNMGEFEINTPSLMLMRTKER